MITMIHTLFCVEIIEKRKSKTQIWDEKTYSILYMAAEIGMAAYLYLLNQGIKGRQSYGSLKPLNYG